MEQNEYSEFLCSSEERAIIEARRRRASAEEQQTLSDNPDKGRYGAAIEDIKPFCKPEEKQHWVNALRKASADRGK